MGEDMEIRNIITFVRIAELQNFSKAAEQLGYSQSAVTMQIKQLEAELNTQLFERIGKRIKLTQAGSRLLPCALAVLDAVRQAEDITREPGNLTGKLRIGTAESLLISVLPPIIIEFSRLCPHVELSTHTALVSDLFDMVRQNDIDLLYFLDQRTNFTEWVKVVERRESAFFVTSPYSPLAGKKNIPLERLVRGAFSAHRKRGELPLYHGAGPCAKWSCSASLFGNRQHRYHHPAAAAKSWRLLLAGVCGAGLSEEWTAGGAGYPVPGNSHVEPVGLPS